MVTKHIQGFTLIEFLIAAVLIGMLTSIGTFAFIGSQRTSRDSRRRADLKNIQNALEQYYLDNNSTYPAGCNPGASYLNSGFPKDPRTGVQYAASVCNVANSLYCFCATMEQTGTGNANAATCAAGSFVAGNYFCVQQLGQ